MAKQGQIAGVGIAHGGDTEYLKSIPDGSENNNLSNLPSVSPNDNNQAGSSYAKTTCYGGANGGIFCINCLYHEIEVGL